MAPKNSGKQWGSGELVKLALKVRGNTPTRLIAWELGRSEDAIRAKALELRLSLKPTNQSPYNRSK